MRNVYEVLRLKELDMARVRQEIEALRCVATLLAERSEMQSSDSRVPERNRWPLQVEELPGRSVGP
jgi:hypothetical protein